MPEINLGSKVLCSDGPCGKVEKVIVNPVTKKVTHIVVVDKKLPGNDTRLVPAGNILKSTEKQITLRCMIQDVAQMPVFEYTQYIQESGPGMAYHRDSTYYFPYSVSDASYDYGYMVNKTVFSAVDVENIPRNELAIAVGMEISASDGKIGKLDELVLDRESGEITHLLMQEGHLWGKKEVSIPVSSVSHVGAKTIHLKISKEAVERLPVIPVNRIHP